MTPALRIIEWLIDHRQDAAEAMRSRLPSWRISTAALCAATLATASAAAKEVYDDVFFVKTQASATAMFQDRDGCRREAEGQGGNAASYSNPEYGALNAMGSALDEDALHEGGLHKRLQRAVFGDCMKRLGWIELQPAPEDAKAVQKASLRHPEALDAWLKTHAPAPPAPPASSSVAAKP